MNDRIEKRIELKAPVSRVWRALTDYREFGEWFRVKLDGPFVPGQISRGRITHPGYEHIKWEVDGAEDGARAAFFFHLASSQIHRESGLPRGLLERADYARRIPSGENCQWYAPRGDRIRFRQASR